MIWKWVKLLKEMTIEDNKTVRPIVQSIKGKKPRFEIIDSKDNVIETINLRAEYQLVVKDGQEVVDGDKLAVLPTPVICRDEGKVRFKDTEEGLTVKKQLDTNGNLQSFILDHPELEPRIQLLGRRGVLLGEYSLPPGSFLNVKEDEDVFEGQILVKTDKIVQEKFENIEILPVGAILTKKAGEEVRPGDLLASWDTYFTPITAEVNGTIRFEDLKEGVTLRRSQESDDGMPQMIVTEHKENLHPNIVITDKNGNEHHYAIPTAAQVVIEDKAEVHAGDILAKIPQEKFKSRDVTGGLPRIEEIFEARRPKQRELAVISKYDGWVRLPRPNQPDPEIERQMDDKGIRRKKGTRWIVVVNNEGDLLDAYKVDVGKHVIVKDGDWVQAGDKLVDGSIDPHEYLEVMGEKKTQEYLLNEVQEVYRLQGVGINDKHVEVMIRQMMKKVTVIDPGTTIFLHDEDVERAKVLAENERVLNEGGTPASFTPRLLGITKASLGTESFISAASFQETTRVLTHAAICGKSDDLLGLKENVIVGHLIPAGTGNVAVRHEVFKKLIDDREYEKSEAEDIAFPEPESNLEKRPSGLDFD